MAAPMQEENNQPEAQPTAQARWNSAPGLAGMALIGAAFVLMAFLSWRKWPDAIIDFGSQLYIPWRISQGAVLYRDLFYFAGGPLSQYFNALLFSLFGVSFSVLIAANLFLSATMVAFIYRRFLVVSNVLTATTISLGVVTVFIFSQYVFIGNYNFIAPYSHEVLHGILLTMFGLSLLAAWVAQPKVITASLAGLCAGLLFLTKPDIFLAFAACCCVALILCWVTHGLTREILKSLAGFCLAALIPLFLFFLFFLHIENWHDSLRSVIFGWLPALEPAIRNNIFYVTFRGMDQPLTHLREMVVHFSCVSLAFAFYAAVFRWMTRGNSRRSMLHWIIWFLLSLPLMYWSLTFPWMTCGSSLPLWCLALLVTLRLQIRNRTDAPKVAFPLLWTVFSLALMSKLGVFARIYHCGFALAMPAFVVTVYFLLWLLPRLLEMHWQVPARFLRATFLVVLLIGYVDLVHKSQQWYNSKQEAIGHGGDTMYTFGPSVNYGDGIKAALDWVDRNIPATGTLAVLPSGVTLNYLSHRINPTPCLFWDPNSMALWGQASMTARFEATPPDYILLVDQSQAEFGVGNLGSYPGYGVELMDWVKQNYKVAIIIGEEPLKNKGFGIEILRHIPASSSTPAAAGASHSS